MLFHWNFYFSGTDEEGGYSAAMRMRLHSRTRLRTKGRDKGQEQSSASNKVRLYSYMIKSYVVSIIKLSVIHDRIGILISTLIPIVIYSRGSFFDLFFFFFLTICLILGFSPPPKTPDSPRVPVFFDVLLPK